MIAATALVRRALITVVVVSAVVIDSASAVAQLTQRGFVDVRGTAFPRTTPNDSRQTVGDLLWREEVFLKLSPWLQLAGGIDGRANSYEQVEREWRLDVRDRRPLRPALSLRRASATISRGALTIDLGKQFIRWGKAYIVTPTDRFAPRDFIHVIDPQFLPVTGARAVAEFGAERLEVAVVPWLTPSRMPLLTQRWTIVPPSAGSVTLIDVTSEPPRKGQAGVRWGHTGAGYELSIAAFNGSNTLPNVDIAPGGAPGEVTVARVYPNLRMFGADAAVPLRWFTIKAEGAFFSSSSPRTDDYVLYVVQVERQSGEWLFLGGYTGEAVVAERRELLFAPDRGLTRAFVARASKTLDANRSVVAETAIRQNGAGAFVKAEYSQASGDHWRATVAAAWLGGRETDFLGQYGPNSHFIASLRYSY